MSKRLNQLGGEYKEGTDSNFYPKKEVEKILSKVNEMLGRAVLPGDKVRDWYRKNEQFSTTRNTIGVQLNQKIMAAFDGKTDAETVVELEAIAEEVNNWLADFDETAGIVRQIIALRPK